MTPPASTKPRAAVVYNPTKVDLAELRNAVALAESESGWAKSRWLETTADAPGKGKACEAAV